MRPSSRTKILDAAFRLAGREGGSVDITFDATAQEAGVTKGGVQYHFHTRDELVLAVCEYVAERVEEAMVTWLGKPFEETTAQERIHAYIAVVAAGRISRADLAVFVESLANPDLGAPWEAVMGRWLKVDDVVDQDLRVRLLSARLAADGLWIAEATGVLVPGPDRDALIAQLHSLINPAFNGKAAL
ncbi:TetR/AcrR family transcriptional regulator [Kribbella sp. NBC_01245]|uniref:TetR/AcrR family transcriptional regulator n=1 Tax=Kribbella sp. NBC_01245 TaxID=2903578 RepID=UPI002E2AB3FC|nr:TetR/AcrR family transcriptional regulator [Kribbella sp. NBC_01245]